MRGLDYRSVVGQKPDFDSGRKAYVLCLGSVELEPISYSTLLTLRDCPDVVSELLDLCFSDRPVMWADLAGMSPGSYGTSLGEVEILLAAIDQRLESADRPGCGVLARIVELWRELTLAALRRLENEAGSDTGMPTRAVATDYRRSAFPCVKALLELLPEEDASSIKARKKLEEGKAWLGDVLPTDPGRVGEAVWRKTESDGDPEDQGFVTWGIP